MTDYPTPPKDADTLAALAVEHGYFVRRWDSHGGKNWGLERCFWHHVIAVKGDLIVEVKWTIRRPGDIFDERMTVGRWSRDGRPVALLRHPEADLERWSKGYAYDHSKQGKERQPRALGLQTLADAKRLLALVGAEAWVRMEEGKR